MHSQPFLIHDTRGIASERYGPQQRVHLEPLAEVQGTLLVVQVLLTPRPQLLSSLEHF